MLTQNVVNPNKKGKIKGRIFHLFYPDSSTSILFDRNLSEPIIFGSKNVVMTNAVKKLDELMDVKPDTKVIVYSYILVKEGYRRTDTYNGPIETIGRDIKRH